MIDLNSLKQLNKAVYGNYSRYEVVDRIVDADSSLFAIVVKLKNEYILVIKGSKEGLDYRNDVAMFRKHLPKQAYRIELFFKKHPEINIVTGHSLGGSLAQYLGASYNIPTITFSAFGIKDIKQGLSDNQIINYGMETDACFMSNIDKHYGKVFILPNNEYHPFIQNNKINYKLLKNKFQRIRFGFKCHLLEQYNDFSKAIQFNLNEFNKVK